MDNTELTKEFMEIYNSNRDFTQEELENFVDWFDMWNLQDVCYGDMHRWNIPVSYICKVGERYFSIDRFEALTECQEHEDWEQPYEVRPRTVLTTVYDRIEEEENLQISFSDIIEGR